MDPSLILVTELTATCECCVPFYPVLHHSYTDGGLGVKHCTASHTATSPFLCKRQKTGWGLGTRLIVCNCTLLLVVMSGSEERCVCLGWALLSVFDRTTTTAGISSSTRHTSSMVRGGGVRLALYEGSPRALYSMGHPGTGEPCVCVCTCMCI